MSYASALALIQAEIVANGNNEITADVLRPILVEMLDFPNEVIGQLNDLDTSDITNIVNAINSIISQNLPNATALRLIDTTGINTNQNEILWARDAINQTAINNGAFTCELGEQMVFYTDFLISDDGTTFGFQRRYYRLTTGATVVNSLGTGDFPPLMQDGVENREVLLASSLVIDLGNIGAANVQTAFNADPSQPFAISGDKFVQAIQSGVNKLWQWIGGDGSFGNSATLAVSTDFIDLTDGVAPPLSDVLWGDITGNISNQTDLIEYINSLLGVGLTGSRLINGGYYNIPNTYEYFVWADAYIINGTLYQGYISDTVTLSVADPTDNRFDVIVINSAGTITVVEGTASPNPTFPIIDTETQLIVTTVLVTAATTAPVGVVTDLIYDENLQVAGGEWDTLASAGSINLASTEQAESGTKSIKFTNASGGANVNFTDTTNHLGSDLSLIRLGVYLPSASNYRFSLIINDANNEDSTLAAIVNGQYGFDSSVMNQWQTIIIPAIAFGGIAGITYDNIVFTNERNNSTFYIDKIELQEGIEPVIGDLPDYTLAVDGSNLQLVKDGFIHSVVTLPGASSTLTTKGDLLSYDTAPNRLPVGADGHVLTADSLETLGVKWTAVAGTGDVVGPASAVDSNFASFDTTTGKLIKDSGTAPADFVTKALFDANTILSANTDNTPAPITIGEQQIVLRPAGGNIKSGTAAEAKAILNYKEEEIIGTATINNAATGTLPALNFGTKVAGYYNLTGAITLSITEPTLATNESVTRILMIKANGFGSTLPTEITSNMTGTYDTAKRNLIAITYLRLDGSTMIRRATLTAL